MAHHTLQRPAAGRRRAANTVLALFLAIVGSLGLAGVATADVHQAAQPSCGDTASYTQVDLSSLPAEASDTVDLIKSDGPYPYPEDGTVFSNREGILPSCASGYYHEFTVETPGSDNRGTRRIVTGSDGEYFYTGDHYESFQLVDINA